MIETKQEALCQRVGRREEKARPMVTLEDRKRRGQETIKRYRGCSGTDPYACAVDAIADILLFVAQGEDEGTQILQAAEMDFRNAVEGESFVTEG